MINKGRALLGDSYKKEEFRLIWVLALPTVIEQLLMTVVQYADTAMVGRISAEASAAVGVTLTCVWLSNAPLYAVGVGVLACIARFAGEGDQERVRTAAMQAVILTVVVGLAEGALMVGLSPFIPRWLGADRAIQRDAFLYYGIISIPMLFRSAVLILGAAIRAVKDTKGPMMVNIIMNIVNLILNFLFIYEPRTIRLGGMSVAVWGAGWGVTGAAVATAVSFTLGGLLMLWLFARNKELSIVWREIHFDRPLMSAAVSIGIPVALERICVSLGHVVFTGLITSLGTVAMAAHSIALTAEQAFYIPGYGMQTAIATLIGNALGEKNVAKIKRICKMSLTAAVVILSATGALLFIFSEPMMRFFSSDAAVIAMGSKVLKVVAFSEPMFAVVIILEGVYNGAGYTKVPFVLSLVTTWGVRVLSVFVCVKFLHAGLTVVWLCMIADNLVKGICSVVIYFRGRWMR